MENALSKEIGKLVKIDFTKRDASKQLLAVASSLASLSKGLPKHREFPFGDFAELSTIKVFKGNDEILCFDGNPQIIRYINSGVRYTLKYVNGKQFKYPFKDRD